MLKLGIYMDSVLMYVVYRNKAVGAYSSIYFSIFLIHPLVSSFSVSKFQLLICLSPQIAL